MDSANSVKLCGHPANSCTVATLCHAYLPCHAQLCASNHPCVSPSCMPPATVTCCACMTGCVPPGPPGTIPHHTQLHGPAAVVCPWLQLHTLHSHKVQSFCLAQPLHQGQTPQHTQLYIANTITAPPKFPHGHTPHPQQRWPAWVPLTRQRASTAHNRQRASKDECIERKSGRHNSRV